MSVHPVPEYQALIASDRVSTRTREALLAREADDAAYCPAALDQAGLATLRAVLDRVLPQPAGEAIDLAARIDRALASGTGDGWRFADLPPDAEAYRAGLATLEHAAVAEHGAGFAALDGPARDALLARAAEGVLDGSGLSAGQARRWFEDVRADAVRLYVAHPATLSRMRYGGIAYGGDGPDLPGFTLLEPGAREAWEPA